MNAPFDLATYPLHLGAGGTAVPQPAFTGEMAWYMAYGARHASDGPDGRLITLHTFTESWTSWEMHPAGEELVICVAGEMTLVQEIDGLEQRSTLRTGQVAVNPRGVWHTADLPAGGSATALFVTPGLGTDGRPR